MKRKLWSVLGVVLMMVFTLMACSSSNDNTLSSKKAITAYSLAGVVGTINEAGKTIAVTMPYGTIVTALKATFTTTGHSVKVGSTVQETGTTANNFTSPVDYKVSAANGSSVTYTVTVTVAPSTAKAITAFSFTSPAAVGVITESTHSIAVTVPACTNVTALVATFITTGASVKVGTTVQATGTTANDFTSPVVYTVTAADASTQNYTVAVTVASGGCWTAKTAFGGTARKGAVGFSIGTKGYIGTGWDGSVLFKDFWMYDPVAGTWTQKVNFAGTDTGTSGLARTEAVGFSIGTKGYVGTGYDDTPALTKDFWEFDSVANTWKKMTDFGGTARRAAVGFSIGTKGYVGTGDDGTPALTKDFYEFDPAGNAGLGSWTAKLPFGGTARKNAVGILIGTKGYIGTGTNGTAYYKDWWEYNPAANTWAQKTDFGGEARAYAIGFGSTCTNGYVGLGNVPCGYDKDFWEYDPTANTWTPRTDFGGTARGSAVGFMISGLGYVGTGWDGSVLFKDFWEYQP
jgi:N-acetylneuraminic acid mutarotase